MNTGMKQFAIGAVLAFIAFAFLININSAWSDKIGHGWHIGIGVVFAIAALYFLGTAISGANRRDDDKYTDR